MVYVVFANTWRCKKGRYKIRVSVITTSSPSAERLPVNSSHGHLVTRSSRHSVNSSPVNSSQARFFHRVNSSHGQVVTQSSRHKPALNTATGTGPKFTGHADIKGH